jgi:hypothetical protein
MGPVQVLVVGFDEPTFSGDVLVELARLRDAGIVRLLDLLVVERREDGTFHTVDTPGAGALGLGELAVAVLAHPNGDGTAADQPGDETWSLADVVAPGSVAAVALIEHLWAGPLTDAIARAGGTPLDETWLPTDERASLEAALARRS